MFLRSHLGLCTATPTRKRWFGSSLVSNFPTESQCYTHLTADLRPSLWRRLLQNPSGPMKSKAPEKSGIGNFGESCQVFWIYFKYCQIDQNFCIVIILVVLNMQYEIEYVVKLKYFEHWYLIERPWMLKWAGAPNHIYCYISWILRNLEVLTWTLDFGVLQMFIYCFPKVWIWPVIRIMVTSRH